jgi:trehalose utilization protein
MVLAVALTFAVGFASLLQVAHEPAAARVVLVSGEEEYDAEASLSALAHLLADRHGMTTTLASSHSPSSVTGLDALASADLAILFVRSRTWPEAEWKRLEEFLARGGALVAMRSSIDGFGTRFFGASLQWDHGPKSSTDVFLTPRPRYPDDHDLLRGVAPKFHVRSPLDHLGPLPEDVNVVARGTAVDSERAKAEGAAAKEGPPSPDLQDPVAWTRVRPDGGRTFYTSMGHPDDFDVADFRRLLVNGIYWTLKRPTGPPGPPPKRHRGDPAPAKPPPPTAPPPIAELDVTLPVTTPLTSFEVSTPYASDWSKPIESQHFPPEEGIAGFNDVQWIKVASPDGSLDFRKFDPTSKQGTIYAKTTLHAAGSRQLELVLQSDDGFELFVDQKSRFAKQEVRTLHAGCDCVPLDVADGDHELMFKVMNAGGAWGLRVRSRDLTEYREDGGKGH